jgi:hypothetical protein
MEERKMKTTLNLESKEKLDCDTIKKLLQKHLTTVDNVSVKQIHNVSADNGITYVVKVLSNCDSKVLLSQLYSISKVLDQDCIAFSSSDSVLGRGFIGIKPYDKFDDELFIDYDSLKPLATVKGVER